MKKTFLLLTIYCLLSTTVLAQETVKPTDYKLLAPLPGVETTPGITTAGPYIKGIFTLMIAIAGALAVLAIIFGGIKYMSTDAFGGKSEAKTTIEHAIWGLLLAMSAWLILFTVNPNLVKFNLSIPIQPIPANTNPPVRDITLPADPSNCLGCRTLSVPHKPAPTGCAAPGPCRINATLNSRLQLLDLGTNFLVTESFPPTRIHSNPCHLNGTCVDATISSNTPQNIKSFIDKASVASLTAQFETTTEKEASDIRAATGLSEAQVKYIPGITGSHFSVYLK